MYIFAILGVSHGDQLSFRLVASFVFMLALLFFDATVCSVNKD